MSDSPRDFLPRRRLLRPEYFRQIVEDEDVAGVRAARAERTHGDRKVQDASGSDRFDFPRYDSHAQRSAHEVAHNAGCIRSKKCLEGMGLGIAAVDAEHF